MPIRSINSYYHVICGEIITGSSLIFTPLLLYHALYCQLAEKGDLALLENLVRKSPEVLSEKDECGASPLHHAAAGGYITLIQFITTVIDSQGRHASVIDHKLHSNRGKIFVL